MSLTLDVGCGAHACGTVNIDAFPNNYTHINKKWNPKKTPNFIQAEAQTLPFRNDIFDKIFCNHVLEHIYNPKIALEEMNRVTNDKVLVIVPSEFNLSHGSKGHIYTWNKYTLENLFKLIFPVVKVDYQKRILLGRRLTKYLPFLNGLLSKLGLHPLIYAIGVKRKSIPKMQSASDICEKSEVEK